MSGGTPSAIAPYGSNNELVLRVLDAVYHNPQITQRSVARELGIALGLANAYVNRCVRKGFIKIIQVPSRRYAYYITPRGLAEKSRLTAAYLSHSFRFFREARAQLGELFIHSVLRRQVRLALIGEGDLADIARLVAIEHPVEVVRVVRTIDDLNEKLPAIGPLDAVIVTAIERCDEIFQAAVKEFGLDRVYAPALLGVRLRIG